MLCALYSRVEPYGDKPSRIGNYHVPSKGYPPIVRRYVHRVVFKRGPPKHLRQLWECDNVGILNEYYPALIAELRKTTMFWIIRQIQWSIDTHPLYGQKAYLRSFNLCVQATFVREIAGRLTADNIAFYSQHLNAVYLIVVPLRADDQPAHEIHSLVNNELFFQQLCADIFYLLTTNENHGLLVVQYGGRIAISLERDHCVLLDILIAISMLNVETVRSKHKELNIRSIFEKIHKELSPQYSSQFCVHDMLFNQIYELLGSRYMTFKTLSYIESLYMSYADSQWPWH